MKNKFEFNHFTKSPLFLLQIFNLLSKTLFTLKCFIHLYALDQGEGDTPYNGLHGEASPKRGTFSRLQVYERVGISPVEVYELVGKSVTWSVK